MAISMYKVSIPLFIRGLTSLSNVLKKGDAFAQAAHTRSKSIEPDNLLQQRLIFDMFPLVKQIQIACDTAARSGARLAGAELPSFPDTETTLTQAQARIQAAISYLKTLKAEPIDASADRKFTVKMGGNEVEYTGYSYLTGFALPNFYFHCTTAYAILRVAGVQIGKRDYLG